MAASPSGEAPDLAAAREAARRLLGSRAVWVERFTTGSCHWVFDVRLETGASAVLRMTEASRRPAMAGALEMSELLRPKGVPLPAVLVADLDSEFPTLVLERLPGTDLGHVIGALDHAALDAIAGRVASAQRIVASLPAGARFGYATKPEAAPHASWPEFLRASLARSRRRLAAAGLFPQHHADRVEALLGEVESVAQKVEPVAFLHDTTTRNVIVTERGGFSGIVDVDDLGWGDPRFAPALTLAAIQAFGGPRRHVDTWMRVAGFAADRLFRAYVALLALDLLAELGTPFNGNEAATNTEARTRLLAAFEAAARAADG